MVEVFKMEQGGQSCWVRAVDWRNLSWGRGAFGTDENLALGFAGAPGSDVDRAVRVTAKDKRPLNHQGLVMGDYRGELGVGTEESEGLLKVLADGGRGATRAVDGGGLRVAGDYVFEMWFPKGEEWVEGVG